MPPRRRYRQVDQLPRWEDGWVDPGHGQAHVAGPSAQGGPAHQPRGAGHARGTGHHLDRRLPFVRLAGAEGQEGGHVEVADQPAPDGRIDEGPEPYVGDLHLARQVGPGAERLERGKGDRDQGRHGTAALDHFPREAGNSRRYVDRQHRRTPRGGR